MRPNLLSHYLLLFIVLAAVSFSAPARAGDLLVQMEPPAGYVEITIDEYPEYIKAVASEFFSDTSQLSRLFLPKEELPYLRSWDVDKITRSVLLFSAGINTQSLPGRWLHPLFDQKSEAALKPTVNVREIENWLGQTKGQRKKRLEFGPLPGSDDCQVYLSVGDNNDRMSAGMVIQRPVATADVYFLLPDQAVLIMFFAQINSADDALTIADQAMEYMRQKPRFTLAEGTAPTGEQADYALLTLAAEKWAELGKTDKAVAAYQRMSRFWEQYDPETLWLSVFLKGKAATLLIFENRYDEAEPLVKEAMEKGKNLSGESSFAFRLAQELMAAVYLNTGRARQAKDMLREYPVDAVPGPVHLQVLFMLTESSVELGEGTDAVAYGKKALHQCLVLPDYKKNAAYLHALADAYDCSGTLPTALFFSLLAVDRAQEELDSGTINPEEMHKATAALVERLEEAGRTDAARKLKNEDPRAMRQQLHTLVTEQEKTLKARYDQVAAALRETGEKNSAENKKAKDDFFDWLTEIEAAWK